MTNLIFFKLKEASPPEYRFKGLNAGDRWCLCALRWREAFEAAVAPKAVLESTHEQALDYVTLKQLCL